MGAGEVGRAGGDKRKRRRLTVRLKYSVASSKQSVSRAGGDKCKRWRLLTRLNYPVWSLQYVHVRALSACAPVCACVRPVQARARLVERSQLCGHDLLRSTYYVLRTLANNCRE